jgi:DNA polymerase bacteriophage-type
VTPLEVIGDVLRSMICAAPGHELIAGDFSQIESRILSTLAGETWKLDAFREYDRTGDPAHDVYCRTATRILRREVTPADDVGRQIGKKGDLSFGYGGGLGAWRRFDSSDAHSDADVEEFKIKWHEEHPATVRFWHALERSLHKAMRTGERVVGRKAPLACEFVGGDLYLILPSGRRIVFPEARFAPGRFGRPQIVFKNKDRNDDGSGGEGAWGDKAGWYGLFTARAVSGIARDLLAAAMQRVEAAGYPVVLTVHDEVICEVSEGLGSIEEFRALMTEPPIGPQRWEYRSSPRRGAGHVMAISRPRTAITRRRNRPMRSSCAPTAETSSSFPAPSASPAKPLAGTRPAAATARWNGRPRP